MGFLFAVSGSTDTVLLLLLLQSQRCVMKEAAHPLSDLFSFHVWKSSSSLGRKT